MTPDDLAAIVREYTEQAITAALAPVLEREKTLLLRISELESRPVVGGLPGEKGDPGLPGVGIVSVVISADQRWLVTLSDARTIDAGPVPQPAAGPPGPQGIQGEKGLDGAPGLQGKDGRDGLDGKDGAPGLQGKDGRDGLDGKDGAPGLHGKDGADGMTLDDVDLDCTDAGWVFSVGAGGQTKSWAIPFVYDLGVWAAGTTYAKGSGVSWDGGYWIATATTRAQPGGGSPDWRLAVRRGHKGAEGKPGKDGRDFRPSNTPPLYS